MVNLDRIRAAHADLKNFGEGGGGDVNFLKLESGSNIIRLLPPKSPREDFWKDVKIRWGIGPNGKKIFSPPAGQPDPAKAEYDRLIAEGDDVSKKRANEMREKKRALLWVLDRGAEDKGYQLFDINLFVLRDILAIFMDSDYGDITHPETGCDVTINFTPGVSKKTFPQWQVVPRRNSTPLGHPEFLEEDLFDKHRVGRPSDADYVEACIAGTEKAFLDAQKLERDANAPAGPTAKTEIEEAPSKAPAQSEDAAMAAELDKLRAKKAAAPPPPPPSKGTPVNIMDADGWYAVLDGGTAGATSESIQALVDDGKGDTLICHDALTGNAWKKATEVGFVASAGPPPPPTQVGQDLEAALG